MTKSPDSSAEQESFDVAVVGGKTEDGDGLRVLRLRPDGVALGEVRPLKEGKAINGEVVKLTPRQDNPLVCDVDVQVARPALPAAPAASAAPPPALVEHSPRLNKPAQVATPAYRDGWERVFGPPKKQDLN